MAHTRSSRHHVPPVQRVWYKLLSEVQIMSAPCQLSPSRLGLLCGAALVLGADLILICWRFADGQPLWVPALGGVATMPTGSVVLKDREQKIAQNAEARLDTHHLLRMHRGENSLAAFRAEHY